MLNNDKPKGRFQTFAVAMKGLATMVASQRNARVHIVITIAVVVLGLYLGLPAAHWAVIVLTIALVFAAEAFNTAVEFLSDAVTTEYNPLIGKAKDVSAGAVLVSAIGAGIVGLIIFVPPIFRLLTE